MIVAAALRQHGRNCDYSRARRFQKIASLHNEHDSNKAERYKETFKKHGAGGIPKVVLIDTDGIVRYFQQGRSPNQDFHAEVTKLGL